MPLPGLITFSLGGGVFLCLGFVLLRNPGGRGVRLLRRAALAELASQTFYTVFSKMLGSVFLAGGIGLILTVVLEISS